MGETPYGLFIGTVSGLVQNATLSTKSFPQYKDMKNFVAVVVAFPNWTAPRDGVDNPIAKITGYDADNGIVSVFLGWHKGESYMQGVTANIYSVK